MPDQSAPKPVAPPASIPEPVFPDVPFEVGDNPTVIEGA